MSRNPSPSPTERAVHYSLEGLHLDWDNDSVVRRRVRWGNHVIRHFDPQTSTETNQYVEKTLVNVRLNKQVLKPLCVRMRSHELALPIIDAVIEEFRNLYCFSKVTVSYDTLYQEAWACRRLLALAKNTLLHRKYISEDRVLYVKGYFFHKMGHIVLFH